MFHETIHTLIEVQTCTDLLYGAPDITPYLYQGHLPILLDWDSVLRRRTFILTSVKDARLVPESVLSMAMDLSNAYLSWSTQPALGEGSPWKRWK